VPRGPSSLAACPCREVRIQSDQQVEISTLIQLVPAPWRAARSPDRHAYSPSLLAPGMILSLERPSAPPLMQIGEPLGSRPPANRHRLPSRGDPRSPPSTALLEPRRGGPDQLAAAQPPPDPRRSPDAPHDALAGQPAERHRQPVDHAQRPLPPAPRKPRTRRSARPPTRKPSLSVACDQRRSSRYPSVSRTRAQLAHSHTWMAIPLATSPARRN
jgi:hypothetical protein